MAYLKEKKTIGVIIYALVLILINIWIYRFSTDLIVISLIIAAFILGRSKQFVKDWTIPIFLFFVYEQTRAQASNFSLKLGFHLFNKELIWLESKIFFFLDEIPPVAIQQWLRPDLNVLHWYDYVLFFFYIMFFWYWFAIGFVIWTKSRDLFKKYIYGLVGFSLFDVLIYFVLPTAPPWWAAQNGDITYIERILWTSSYLPSDAIQYVHTYGVNDFAAVPSHHVAWPFFATLFLIKIYGKKAWPLMIIPIIIAFATWYGAEHYVIDSIAGVIIALIAYWIVMNKKKISNSLHLF
jgi:hypothetical protein